MSPDEIHASAAEIDKTAQASVEQQRQPPYVAPANLPPDYPAYVAPPQRPYAGPVPEPRLASSPTVAEIAAKEVDDARQSVTEKLGAELVHMETELRAHGLTIADLLRTIAKNFHGVTVPVYQEEADDILKSDAEH